MELILHLGPHRTGTTALQMMLQRQQSALERDGIRYWGPEIMRIGHLRDFVPIAARAHGDLASVARLAPMVAALHEEFELAEAEGTRRLVVSDENLLGSAFATYAKATLYPGAKNWLIATASLFPRAPDHIYLGVRDYAEFSVSLYSQLVSRLDLPAFDPARFEAMGERCRWQAVLADIRAVFPHSRVHVWRYVRDPRMVPGVAAAMLGKGQGWVLPHPRMDANAGLSRPAVEAIAALWRANIGQPPAAVRPRADVLRKLEGPAFDPFTSDQRARMAARFEADWRALAAGEVAGVEVFDPLALEGAL